MWMGGLRIFGTKSRVVQKPTMGQRAAKAFAKYHEIRGRVLDGMETQKTKMRIFLFLMLAKRAQEEKTGVKKDRDEVGEGSAKKEMRTHPVGMYQDASRWFNSCGGPRYPVTTRRSAVHHFEGESKTLK